MNLVNTPLGNISIVNVHLHATDEDRRLSEINQVLASDRVLPKLILLGNLNAISPSDDRSENSFDQSERRFDVISRLMAEGLTDVLDNKFKYVKPYKVYPT